MPPSAILTTESVHAWMPIVSAFFGPRQTSLCARLIAIMAMGQVEHAGHIPLGTRAGETQFKSRRSFGGKRGSA